ncbi:TNT domain-containing protein [Agromyces aerolatus]|uniref:TNT domain-containing protein n=1 Tax=Agromyces sp. LY-1074 TaxID=3074080 RepID=UPI00285CFE64|nr:MULTISPECIES: TNT domain-containing protein [unclassified Agromyces]MDR5698416.1 TNT domain-containing protein [Agromyces sp. LY-1074]MDR5704710.1 TNT domain-containing protein [Agromyces sp. LY-1358]
MFDDLRRQLDDRRIPRQAVVLPGDDAPTLQGALALVADDGGFDLVTVDYGRAVPLGRTDHADAAAALLLDYLDRPLPEPKRIGADEYRALAASTAEQADELRPRLAEGPLLTRLPAGLAVDRIGALDGVQLFPAETSVEQRALPPTSLTGDARLHRFLTAADVLVRVEVVAPWFGQPGGGVRFTLADDFVGIRDLVESGALAQALVE